MEENINDFIECRLNANIHILKKSKKRQEYYKKFEKQYDELFKELSEEQKEKISELIAIKDLIEGVEQSFAYQLGKNDTLEIMKTKFHLDY